MSCNQLTHGMGLTGGGGLWYYFRTLEVRTTSHSLYYLVPVQNAMRAKNPAQLSWIFSSLWVR